MSDSEKIKVQCCVRCEGVVHFDVEMTRAEYDEWCEQIDAARGFEREQVAGELIDFAGVDLMRSLDFDDMEVDDFCEKAKPHD